MSPAPISVLVADDHAVVREGIRSVLVAEPGFRVVGAAADAAEALTLAQRHEPDVVLLDITMPGESGLSVASRLRDLLPTTRVLVLSMHDRTEYLLEAVRAGASGYLLKDASPATLREAVGAVHRGEAYFCPVIARRLSAALRGQLQADERRGTVGRLTPREREVLVEIATGDSNAQIADRLVLSEATVKTHVSRILAKLHRHDRVQAVVLAYETGLVRPGNR
ncbi:MAG: response regulator [Acidimicrobiales bacterium]